MRATTARIVEALTDQKHERPPGECVWRSELVWLCGARLQIAYEAADLLVTVAEREDAIHVDADGKVRLRADLDAERGANVTTPPVTGPTGGRVEWREGVTYEKGGEPFEMVGGGSGAEDSDMHPLYGARETKAPEGANSAREAAEEALEAQEERTMKENYRMACLDLMRAMLARRDMTAGEYSELARTIAKLMDF